MAIYAPTLPESSEPSAFGSALHNTARVKGVKAPPSILAIRITNAYMQNKHHLDPLRISFNVKKADIFLVNLKVVTHECLNVSKVNRLGYLLGMSHHSINIRVDTCAFEWVASAAWNGKIIN